MTKSDTKDFMNMDRPEKIIIEKLPDKIIRIICVDELTEMANSIDIGENGYKALTEHFKTGAMKISSNEFSKNDQPCAAHGVSTSEQEEMIEKRFKAVEYWAILVYDGKIDLRQALLGMSYVAQTNFE